MINGIYQSAAGLDALQRVQDQVANNLANASTVAFKQTLSEFTSGPSGRIAVGSKTDFTSGPLQTNGGPTQLALGSEGLFAVETPQGPAYTRNGDFRLDAEGRLVTAQGFAVQGEHGTIVLPNQDFTVSFQGEIVVAGEVVDRLKLVRASQQMRAAGNGLWVGAAGETPETLPGEVGQVLQGALEGSNVNLVRTMVDMLTAVRLYEANAKALESQDETLKQATTVGRTA